MSIPPPRQNPTPTNISKQNLTPLQTLLQLGFPKNRAEKALAATGNEKPHLASDWLLAHVNDPTIDDPTHREYILYACPGGVLGEKLLELWQKSSKVCGWNGAHNYTPHITLVNFFTAPDCISAQLSQILNSIIMKEGQTDLNLLKLEPYISPNFMGLFVAENHVDYLKKLAQEFVKDVTKLGIALEPQSKSLHLTLAYQFPSCQYSKLKSLVEELDTSIATAWELRLYSRDVRINGKDVYKVVQTYNSSAHDELDLISGDYIYVLPEALQGSTDGWVEGISWLTGITAQLPVSYTERTAESDAWTLHQKCQFIQTVDYQESKQQINPVGEKSKIYQNLFDLRNSKDSIPIATSSATVRNLYIMRHGERVDITFGSWAPYCYDRQGNYTRKDLNLPQTLPPRQHGPSDYLQDTPLTNVGVYEAILVGEYMQELNTTLEYAYCSPSFRCVQTCDAVLRGLNLKNTIKLRIEPGLFEWTVWYSNGIPNWMSVDELKKAGFNVDDEYVPLVTEAELRAAGMETCAQFYERSAFVARQVFATLPAHGDVLFVAHAASLDVCSRDLLGKPARDVKSMKQLIAQIPYCSLVNVQCEDGVWKMVDPPSMPITHKSNQRFNWKILSWEEKS